MTSSAVATESPASLKACVYLRKMEVRTYLCWGGTAIYRRCVEKLSMVNVSCLGDRWLALFGHVRHVLHADVYSALCLLMIFFKLQRTRFLALFQVKSGSGNQDDVEKLYLDKSMQTVTSRPHRNGRQPVIIQPSKWKGATPRASEQRRRDVSIC